MEDERNDFNTETDEMGTVDLSKGESIAFSSDDVPNTSVPSAFERTQDIYGASRVGASTVSQHTQDIYGASRANQPADARAENGYGGPYDATISANEHQSETTPRSDDVGGATNAPNESEMYGEHGMAAQDASNLRADTPSSYPPQSVDSAESVRGQSRNWFAVVIGAIFVVIGLTFVCGTYATGIPATITEPSVTFGADFYTYIYQAVADACGALNNISNQIAMATDIGVALCRAVGWLICAVGGATLAFGMRKS